MRIHVSAFYRFMYVKDPHCEKLYEHLLYNAALPAKIAHHSLGCLPSPTHIFGNARMLLDSRELS